MLSSIGTVAVRVISSLFLNVIELNLGPKSGLEYTEEDYTEDDLVEAVIALPNLECLSLTLNANSWPPSDIIAALTSKGEDFQLRLTIVSDDIYCPCSETLKSVKQIWEKMQQHHP